MATTGWLSHKAAAAPSGISPIATLTAGVGSGLLVDQRAGILYDLDAQLGLTGNRGVRKNGIPTTTNGPGLRFLDASTFDFLSPDDLPLPSQPATYAADGAGAAVVDERNHLLFYATNGPAVVVVDGLRRKVVGTIPAIAPTGYLVTSMRVTPDGRLWAQVAFKDIATRLPGVVELDPQALIRGSGPVVLAQHFLSQPCVSVANGHAFGVSPTAVYMACAGEDRDAVHQPLSAQGIYTIPLRDGHLPPSGTLARFFAVPGAYAKGWGLYDEQSERIVLMSRGFGPPGAFVFDGRQQAMVGLIGQHGDVKGACVDSRTGRFYAHTTAIAGTTDHGLLVGEARVTPSPQGYAFPQHTGSTFGVMACDGTRRRIFVKKSSTTYQVFQDDIPHRTPPRVVDPDLGTSDTPEGAPGAEVTFQALGRAYGARVVMVGGYANLAFNYFNAGLLDTATSTAPPQCPPRESGIACGSVKSTVAPSSRELVFGAVGDPGEAASVSISNFSVSATANAAARDASTKGDTAAASGRDDERWPAREAFCTSGPGDGVGKETHPGAEAECDPDRKQGPWARGRARSDGLVGVPGGQEGGPATAVTVAVVGASSEVVTRTDPDLGAVTTSTAAARLVTLRAPGASVDVHNVAAIAEVSAKGHVGSARSRYERSIGRLVVNGVQVCGPCAPDSVVAAFGAVPQGNVELSLPGFDVDSFTPTPRGYQAAVVRDRWEQLTDSVLNERSAYDLQVPALRIALKEDSFQHSALLIDIAAPQGEAHRGIKPCAFCGDSPSSPESTAADDAGPTLFTGIADTPGFLPALSTPASASVRTLLGEPGPTRSRKVLQQIVDGLRIVFTSPTRLGRVLLVWSVLALPVYLASRRRLVLQRLDT